jgi:glycosyltransferase involved in cell wall biosynthesis
MPYNHTVVAPGSRPRPESALRTRVAKVSVVVPVFNAMRYLRTTAPALLQAARRTGDVELVFVDNGSTDGTFEYLRSLEAENVRVYRLEHVTIAALRNYGVQRSTGYYISFIDADCIIREGYFEEAIFTLERTGAAATGCEYQPSSPPHWIEATWHHLHYVGKDRFVHYIVSGNFFISRSVFEEVGGFREDLLTGEDSEIGHRIRASGHRIYECTRVAAIHLGNPKSIRQFFRQAVWHALGMFGTVNWRGVDKPSAMMLAHLLFSLAGLVFLASGSLPLGPALVLFLALQLTVPVATVAFRFHQTGRTGRGISGVALYWLYYWARLYALFLILTRQSARYRK